MAILWEEPAGVCCCSGPLCPYKYTEWDTEAPEHSGCPPAQNLNRHTLWFHFSASTVNVADYISNTEYGHLTILAAEIRHSYILQRDLSEEGWTLTARISGHNTTAPEPSSKPGQAAVTVEGIGQEVSDAKI